VRRGAGARQIDPKWLLQHEICRAPGAAHGKLTILCRAPRQRTRGNGTGVPGAWTILCCAPSGTTHDKGHGPPCAWTILCRAPRHVTHGRGLGQPCALTILCRAPSHVVHDKEYNRSRACSAAHGRESVMLSPRGRPSTPFLCRASLIPHGKELCRALSFPKAHNKGLCRAKMQCAVFAVRLGKMHMAKAVPCVF
jgi:hypothetical protein